MKEGKDGEPESVGQLLDDLGNFINNDYSGYKWVYTPDVIPTSRTLDKLPLRSTLQEYSDNITNEIIEGLGSGRIKYFMKKQTTKILKLIVLQ